MPHRIVRTLSRRRFVGAAGAGAAALLAGCGDPDREQTGETPTAAEPTQMPGPTADTTRVYVPGVASDGPLPTPTPGENGPTLEQMVGGILLLGFRGTELTADNPIVADIRDRHLGGVILFSYDVSSDSPVRNITSPEQLAALTAALRAEAGDRTLLIATDQEGGLVARLNPDNGFPPTLSHAELGALNDLDETRAAAAAMGVTLRTAGINWDLAPVVDVNVNPDNPIIGGIERSFSADPAVVSAQASAFIDGLHSEGILTSIKHFPGHGSSLDDSHAGFVDITETWQEYELQPYEDLVAAGQVDSVLVAHVFNANLDPDYPASLSPAIIQGMLRDQIGFDGVVVSDDMEMGAITQEYGFEEAIRLALLAGTDLLTLGNNLDDFDPDLGARVHGTVMDLVRNGDVPEARIAEAYGRVEALRAKLG